MKEYIERATVLNNLGYEENRRGDVLPGSTFDIVLKEPAADVAEVVHGKWEPGNPICPVCGENKFKDLDADVWADWQPKFCPNCGARMGKEDEHEIG